MELLISDLQFGKPEAMECGPYCGVEEQDDHPNAIPFKGVLLVVDEPSDRPPHGAENHLIMVPKKVAEAQLNTLIGMGLNYFDDLDRHNPQKKVGVIQRAWIKGNKVWCSGIIWAKDFPNAQKQLRTRGMGMSMELADVLVEKKETPVWKLVDFSFTGATALLKRAAAYESTTLAASACEISTKGEKAAMSKTATSKTSGNGNLAKLIAAGVSSGLRVELKAAMEPVTAALRDVHASLTTQSQTLGALAAAAMRSDDDDAAAAKSSDDDTAAAKSSDDAAAAMSSDDAAAARTDKDASSSSSSSSDADDGDDDELSAELAQLAKSEKNSLATDESGDDDPEFGHLNKNAKNKGDKKVVSAAAATNNRVFEIAASAVKKAQRVEKSHKKVVKELKAQRDKTRELEEQVEDMQAQADEYVNTMHRRTLPANYSMLLEKAGHSVGDIVASGQKLTVEQQDAIVRAARESGANMSILDAVTFKTKLVEAGLAE